MDTPAIKVMVVDDHRLFRHSLCSLLSEQYDIVGEAYRGEEAIGQARSAHPDVVLMDIGLPGMNGIEATREIKANMPETSVLMVSALDEADEIFEAMRAGASGYVVKDDTPENFFMAVRLVASGEMYLPPKLIKYMLRRLIGAAKDAEPVAAGSGEKRLSARETGVLRLLASGKRDQEIADELQISRRTVSNHVTNIYNKLGIHDRAQATLYAIKQGIIHA